MQKMSTIFSKVYMGVMVLVFAVVMLSQLHIDYSFNEAITTTNYYALVFSAVVFALFAILCYERQYRVDKSDIAIVVLTLFATIHSRDILQTKEVVMSLAYIVIYFSLRIVKSRFNNFDKYATIVILLTGIDQSVVVLRQLYGFEMSNNHDFLVSGVFFNPGPCGIFLSGIFVLALIIVRRGKPRVKAPIIDFAQFYIAYVVLACSFLAIIPTLSRAGWLGAIVGALMLYYKELKRYYSVLCYRNSLNNKVLVPIIVFLCMLSCIGVYLLKKDSANGRVFMWQNTLLAAKESPLLGEGVGTFPLHYAKAQASYFENQDVLDKDDSNVYIAGAPAYPFNEMLALLMSLGAVGVVIVLYIIYQKLFKHKNKYKAMGVAILIASLLSYTFYIPLIAIIFIYAMADGNCNCARKSTSSYANAIITLPLVLLIISQLNVRKEIGVHKEWREISLFYNMEDYDTVIEDSEPLVTTLHSNDRFMFEYGHSLNKTGHYKRSNKILLQGTNISSDPMFWNVIGNNYLALGEYDKGVEAYLRAYYQCPNRLYPIYLLAKLYDITGNNEKVEYYGGILLNKEPKIPSKAVDDMKCEVQQILERIKKYN